MVRRALIVALAGLTGCSWFFTHAPDPNSEKPCNTSEAAPIADGALAGLYLVFVGAGIREASRPNGEDPTGVIVMAGGMAVLHGLAAMSGFKNVGNCRRQQQELYEEQKEAARAEAPRAQNRREAWQLTRQAAIAARAGDCATVISIEQVLLGVDAEFHGTVFMRDIAIVRCLAHSEVPVTPPSETPPVAPATPPSPAPATP